jgi:hypothetical protein
VAFGGLHFTEALRSGVMQDLAAGLTLKGIDACPLGHEGRSPPLAVVQLDAGEEDKVAVAIEVYDALTEKRVIRQLDLREVARDARSLALAAAADELLRASWAELAIEDAPPPARAPPPEIQRTVRESMRPARVGGRDTGWGVRATFDVHAGGQSWLGADTFVAHWLSERIGFELGVGLREGLSVDAAHGQIDSRALIGSADLLVGLLPRGEVVGLALAIGPQVASVRVIGASVAGTRAAQGAGVDVHARAGFLLGIEPWDGFALHLRLCGGVPLRSVKAIDEGEVATATNGPSLHAGVGAELRF